MKNNASEMAVNEIQGAFWRPRSHPPPGHPPTLGSLQLAPIPERLFCAIQYKAASHRLTALPLLGFPPRGSSSLLLAGSLASLLPRRVSSDGATAGCAWHPRFRCEHDTDIALPAIRPRWNAAVSLLHSIMGQAELFGGTPAVLRAPAPGTVSFLFSSSPLKMPGVVVTEKNEERKSAQR